MYLERGPLPSAKTKLGQVGKKLSSFLSWLPTLGTEDVLGPLTTRERESETGADVSGVKCLSVHQHLPPSILTPWLRGHCAPTICPLALAPNRCRGREGGRPAVVILSWLWLPAEVGKGSNEARSTHPTLSHFLFPQDGKTAST